MNPKVLFTVSNRTSKLLTTPDTQAEMAELLAEASRTRTVTRIQGAGTHSGLGYRVDNPQLISTLGLDRIVAWEPADLTVVVEAGIRLADLETQLNQERQTLAWAGAGDQATVGGILASGVSGYQRLRYGPARNQLLQTTLVTGDGRMVTSGARVVKSVSGYDLTRLMVGSMGRLGALVQVCLKLWPLPPATATLQIQDPNLALARSFRPYAVLGSRDTTLVMIGGSSQELDHLAQLLKAELKPGWHWPQPPTGESVWSIRVRPAQMVETVRLLPSDWDFVAEYGVGHVRAAGKFRLQQVRDLREWVEHEGGRVVLEQSSNPQMEDLIDPWGAPPSGLEIQEQLVTVFDPARILNPGILPGRI